MNETLTEKRTRCPTCEKKAKCVSAVTLRALLKDEFGSGIDSAQAESYCESKEGGGASCTPVTGDTGWRFCESPECDVVYFSEQGDTSFVTSQLKVAVGVKETSGERPLCYCFGHSVATIKHELHTRARSDALDDIRAKMNTPGCHCETANPSGSCCLGSVANGIKIAQQEVDVSKPDVQPSPSAKSTAGGVSGAGIASTLEVYRPVFIAMTFGFLGAAFYFTYRPKQKTAAGAGHDCCTVEPADGDNCCAPTGNRRLSVMTLNKVMLWVVTVLAVAFLLFPSYVGLVFGTGNETAVTEDMNRAVFKIDGMTCEGCATTVAQAIRQVNGVMAVDVDYEKRQLVVGAELCPLLLRRTDDKAGVGCRSLQFSRVAIHEYHAGTHSACKPGQPPVNILPVATFACLCRQASRRLPSLACAVIRRDRYKRLLAYFQTLSGKQSRRPFPRAVPGPIRLLSFRCRAVRGGRRPRAVHLAHPRLRRMDLSRGVCGLSR